MTSPKLKDLLLALVAMLACFVVAALVWAWLYPTMTVTISDAGLATFAPGSEQAAFRAFGSFVLATVGISAVVAAWLAWTRPVAPIMLVWVPASALAGSVIFAYLGMWLEGVFHPPTDTLITPAMSFSPVVLVVGPALSLLSYWLTVTMSDGRSN